MRLRVVWGQVATLVLIAGSACSSGMADSPALTPTNLGEGSSPVLTATPMPAVAAWVNGDPVYLADYERAVGKYESDLPLQGLDPDSAEGQAHMAEARSWILDWLITERLMTQAAESAGVVVTDAEVDQELEEMIASVGGMGAFDAQLADWGYANDEFREDVRSQLAQDRMKEIVCSQVPTVAEHVHARHIRVDTLEGAESILARLTAGADFVTLVQAYTLDENTRDSGGDLGFFPQGILVSIEVEDAAFALQPGEWGQVVASSQGYHVVQVVERDPARPISASNLRLLQEQALTEWTDELWAQALIERLVGSAL